MNPPKPQSAVARRRSGVVVPEDARWHGRLAARLIWLLVQGLAATLRWRMDDRSGLSGDAGEQRAIYAVWHNRLALSLVIYARYVAGRKSGRRLAGLVSASRDGGLLAHTMGLFRVQAVRGSSSRRGPQALRELVSAAEDGADLAITPDGPRGPRYVVQDGVIQAAQLTGLPIVPAGIWLGARKELNSWDRFQIPLPFSRVEVVLGEPLWIPAAADDATRESLREELQRRLMAMTRD
jgi:lysophospholipid acyltransferase (LPLAT)-like uncharacterized protein